MWTKKQKQLCQKCSMCAVLRQLKAQSVMKEKSNEVSSWTFLTLTWKEAQSAECLQSVVPPLWSGWKTCHLAWSSHFHSDNPQILTFKLNVCCFSPLPYFVLITSNTTGLCYPLVGVFFLTVTALKLLRCAFHVCILLFCYVVSVSCQQINLDGRWKLY